MNNGMLEHVFLTVVNMSLTASVAVAAVLLARLALCRAPRVLSYGLWAVVLFRLLCPVSFTAGFSLLGALPGGGVSQGRMEFVAGQEIAPPASVAQPPVQTGELPAGSRMDDSEFRDGAPAAGLLRQAIPLASRLWLAGCAGMLACSLLSLLRLKRKLRRAVRERENIYRLPGRGTPFVYGLLRPRIYLSQGLKAEEEAYMLCHEQIHIRRGDPVFRLLGYGALCIHWFNPLIWLAFLLSGRDMEMSCDEAVLKRMGSQVKKSYSRSLLALSGGEAPARQLPVAFGERDTGSRIKNVLRYKRPAVIVTAVAIVACAGLALVLLANPAADGGAGSDSVRDSGNSDGPAVSDAGEARKNVFYGVIDYEDMGGDTAQLVVRIPRLGTVDIPEADEIYPYIEIDYHGLEEGDLVQITFPEAEEIMLMETYPAQFTEKAESIAVMGRGPFELILEEDGSYLWNVPQGMAMDAQPGDTLELYHPEPGTENEEVFASTEVYSVNEEKYQIRVRLSADEVETFMREFLFGVRAEVVKR